MTLQKNAPHARSRWASLLVVLAMVMGLMTTAALAAKTTTNSAIGLDQCRNGSASAPNDCVDLGGSSGWVNGNVGATQGHLLEGYSIPYRSVMTGLPIGTEVTVELGYDITHSGKHAIDYLTHFDRLEPHTFFGHDAEDVLPLDGVQGVSSTMDTEAIPSPGNLSALAETGFNNIPAAQHDMTIFGGLITSAITYSALGDPNASQSEAKITFKFTPDSATAVLAWGGHIARGDQWAGQSASAISGSPYHMRVKTWSLGSVGNQDRSLSAGAVQAGPSSISTAPSAIPTFSAELNDTATVTGDSPTGDVTFRLYGPTTGSTALANCQAGSTTVGSGGLLFAQTVALSGGSATTSGTSSDGRNVTAAGTYVWSASYAGDGGNSSSSSNCAESTTVIAPSFQHVNDPAS